MIHIPLEVETVLLILYELHKAPNHLANSLEISQAIHLSQPLTLKTLAKMKHKGLVKSIRGRGDSDGGFVLAVDLRQLYLGTLIEKYTPLRDFYSKRLVDSVPWTVRISLERAADAMLKALNTHNLYELFTFNMTPCQTCFWKGR